MDQSELSDRDNARVVRAIVLCVAIAGATIVGMFAVGQAANILDSLRMFLEVLLWQGQIPRLPCPA